MTSYKFGLWLLSVSALAIPAQAADSPYITPEEAVSMAITAPNNIKSTVTRSIKSEVVGLNRSYTNLAARRNAQLGKSSAQGDIDWSKTPDNPEDVANKINSILNLNAKPEDFIHLLEPIEEDEADEKNKDNKDSAEKSAEEPITPDNNVQTEINNNTEPEQIEIEDDTVKHLSTRRRFGK